MYFLHILTFQSILPSSEKVHKQQHDISATYGELPQCELREAHPALHLGQILHPIPDTKTVVPVLVVAVSLVAIVL